MKIARSALVTHSAMDMYKLVADVSCYPQFLSWCTATTVHEQNDEMQKASLTVVVAGIRQHFTTMNALHSGERVEMRLLEGPFRNLQGEWCFVQLGDVGCKISGDLLITSKIYRVGSPYICRRTHCCNIAGISDEDTGRCRSCSLGRYIYYYWYMRI